MSGKLLRRGVVLSLLGWPAVALADGVLLKPADLGASRARIEARIEAERARDPGVWAQVEAIDAWRVEGARRSRSQQAGAVSVRLRRLGPAARWVLADLVAFHAPERRGADDRGWHALQVGLLDAVGLAAEPELAPLLVAAFEKVNDAELQSVAAVGLGHLGDAELPLLLAHARAGDPRFVAAVRGLGVSRRPQAAMALASLLDGAQDESQARAVAGALAEAGSSWAWATGKVGSAAEGEAVRGAAAAALVRNYPRFTGPAAPEIELALGRVDHPQLKALIASARQRATPAAAARLDRLTTLAH